LDIVYGADLRVSHPRPLFGRHRQQEERSAVPGAVFLETGRLSTVLTDDFLMRSTGGMRDGRKKGKEVHRLGLGYTV
jgi:hypothetical protein